MGVWLLQQGLLPDHVITSPAERAKATAEKSCKAMGMEKQQIIEDMRICDADVSDLLAVLRDCPAEARRIMLVGHNPSLEELLTYLVNELIPRPKDRKLLPTSALARLKINCDWQGLHRACAQLESITRPGDLPEKFPFPAPGGSELRDRPAYYYTQSAVVPYRLREGNPEILIISSSKRKHLVVPKGIKEPGLTPQESAAKEAKEEAGIEGRVADTPLGSYRYEKWGATCTVDVYPMEVTHVIPQQEWQERHRGREWVSPEQAIKRLKQKELGPLIQSLVTLLAHE